MLWHPSQLCHAFLPHGGRYPQPVKPEHPLLGYDGLTGDLLKAQLRDGTKYCSKETDRFMKSLLDEFLCDFPDIPLYFRGNSGFASYYCILTVLLIRSVRSYPSQSSSKSIVFPIGTIRSIPRGAAANKSENMAFLPIYPIV